MFYTSYTSKISSIIVLPILAGDGGVEPPLADSKSAVLPLDESPIFTLKLFTAVLRLYVVQVGKKHKESKLPA